MSAHFRRRWGFKIIHVGEIGKGTTLKPDQQPDHWAWPSRRCRGPGAGNQGRESIPRKSGDHFRRWSPHRGHGDPRGQDDQTRFFPHFPPTTCTRIFLGPEAGRGRWVASLPATSISRKSCGRPKSQGKGDLDSCSVITVLEAMANTTVQGKN